LFYIDRGTYAVPDILAMEIRQAFKDLARKELDQLLLEAALIWCAIDGCNCSTWNVLEED
jgi:hypothetical protein